MDFSLRLLYLYLFSFVGLIILVIGSIRMIDLGIKMMFFNDADYYESYPAVKMEGEEGPTQEETQAQQILQVQRNRKREFSGALSMIIVGLPLYLYHWNKIKEDTR